MGELAVGLEEACRRLLLARKRRGLSALWLMLVPSGRKREGSTFTSCMDFFSSSWVLAKLQKFPPDSFPCEKLGRELQEIRLKEKVTHAVRERGRDGHMEIGGAEVIREMDN